MLKLDRQAFGGLGNHVKFNIPGTKSVDLHTGDAVINEGHGLFVHRRKVFTQDEMQAVVSTGVAKLRAADPDWRIADHPALDAWLKYEQVAAPAAAASEAASTPDEVAAFADSHEMTAAAAGEPTVPEAPVPDTTESIQGSAHEPQV